MSMKKILVFSGVAVLLYILLRKPKQTAAAPIKKGGGNNPTPTPTDAPADVPAEHLGVLNAVTTAVSNAMSVLPTVSTGGSGSIIPAIYIIKYTTCKYQCTAEETEERLDAYNDWKNNVGGFRQNLSFPEYFNDWKQMKLFSAWSQQYTGGETKLEFEEWERWLKTQPANKQTVAAQWRKERQLSVQQRQQYQQQFNQALAEDKYFNNQVTSFLANQAIARQTGSANAGAGEIRSGWDVLSNYNTYNSAVTHSLMSLSQGNYYNTWHPVPFQSGGGGGGDQSPTSYKSAIGTERYLMSW